MHNELQIFTNIVPDTVSSSLDALRFIYDHGLNTAVTNVATALRIYIYIILYIDNSDYCCIGGKKFSQVEINKKII